MAGGALYSRRYGWPLTLVVPGHGSVFSDVADAVGRARGRLEAYVANPVRHASHAAKVLLKFKLLEVQHAPIDDFVAWAASTAYFRLVWQRWFAAREAHEWLDSLLDELVRSGAAAREGDLLLNA